jgi:hypothetical protein
VVRARELQHPSDALRRSLKRPSGFAPALLVCKSARKRQHNVSRAATRVYRRCPTPRSSRRGPSRWRVHADLHGRHASRNSLRPRLRSSRRLACRREVGMERAAQLSVRLLARPESCKCRKRQALRQATRQLRGQVGALTCRKLLYHLWLLMTSELQSWVVPSHTSHGRVAT